MKGYSKDARAKDDPGLVVDSSDLSDEDSDNGSDDDSGDEPDGDFDLEITSPSTG